MKLFKMHNAIVVPSLLPAGLLGPRGHSLVEVGFLGFFAGRYFLQKNSIVKILASGKEKHYPIVASLVGAGGAAASYNYVAE